MSHRPIMTALYDTHEQAEEAVQKATEMAGCCKS